MRLQSLELIRYGKFDSEQLEFPRAEFDFHFVVGPNEAGKSTIRRAISELLFGMPHKSDLGFRHPQNELRLGAVIQHDQGLFAFERAKATKNSLRDAANQALPESTLQELLGHIDRSFFDQMHGLDHATLVKGGNDILNASSNLGQILFQSATGIDSLGRIHQALVDEADQLWGPRKAAGRAYYDALDQLDQAKTELRQLTVQTREWTEATRQLEEAEQALAEEKQRHAALETRRSQLERVRRTGPDLAVLRQTQSALDELHDAIDFPADAGERLANAREQLIQAEPALRIRRDEVDTLQRALESIQVDRQLLRFAPEIEALAASANQYANCQRDIPLRQRDVEKLLEDAATKAAEIGWSGDEAALRTTLPGKLELKRIADLIKSHGETVAAADNAARAADRKRVELEQLDQALAEIPVDQTSSGLEAALQDAQTWRHLDTRLQTLNDGVTAAKAELDDRMQTLGPWTRPLDALRTMTMPSAERVSRLRTDRDNVSGDLRSARRQLAEADARAEATELEISQFKQSRQLVTTDDVRKARNQRDRAWQKLKSGQIALEQGADAVDDGIRNADELVDSQLGSVSDSAKLQSLQHRLQREQQEARRCRQVLQQCEAALAQLESDWAELCASAGLDGIAIDDYSAWSTMRDAALDCARSLAEKQAGLAREQRAATAALQALRAELEASGVAVAASMSTSELLTTASRHLESTRAASVRRQSLSEQRNKGNVELAELEHQADRRRQQLDGWHEAWQQALRAVRLERFKEATGSAEQAIMLIGELQSLLDKVAQIRSERIEPMQAELQRYNDAAQQLARELDPALLSQPPSTIAKELGTRFASAQQAQKEAERLRTALETAINERRQSEQAVDTARRSLAPLLEAGATDDIETLAALIQRSDRKRKLQSAIEVLRSKLIENGDGLTPAEIASEVDAHDVVTVKARLDSLVEESRASSDTQAMLNEKCVLARQALERIAGGADAATAEARRQEALAAMAQACERYVKVATAARLLKWAIDRYRDLKQAPLLARAGQIFSGLTLGGFARLSVDFDAKPVVLTAMRASGEQVRVEGLSDGTRDQLFLALRLAALEMQIANGQPLPFIADDLFINFDDGRARAGLQALAELSRKTQVIFLSHHDHMLGMVRDVFGASANVLRVGDESERGVMAA